ncbi:YkgJ family cysteine cluster protein, partial [Escherichia albertii]|nr:YkgJ family cysteine cluster protein [Escherichia albertii]
MSNLNPCMACGACCAFFRVSFYWAEADDTGGIIPVPLTQQISPYHRCMQGTNQKNSRCAALNSEPIA